MLEIRKYFEHITGMNESDWTLFSSKLEKESFSKKTTVLDVGATEKYLSFIESGIIRFYIPNPDKDLTFGFAFGHKFVSAYDSFITQTPSSYVLETLTETHLWRISYNDLQEVYAKSEVGNIIGRYAAEQLFLLKSERELSLLNNTAQERYLKLFTDRPEIIKEIPLKYIASYIGVTPQALSRIRKRIS